MDEITQAKRITADHSEPEVAHTAQQLVAEAVAFWEYDPALPGEVSLVLSDDPTTVLLMVHLAADQLEITDTMHEYT